MRPIPKYPRYKVSDDSEIYGPSGLKLSIRIRNGYRCVSIWVDEKSKRTIKVARLVASAYHGLDIDDQGSTVDHIDCNKTNDRSDNLRVLSIHDNILHKHGRLGVDTRTHKLCSVCMELKSRCDFSRNSNLKDGLKSQCKECIRKIRKQINDRRV